jgi:hypothetical protein
MAKAGNPSEQIQHTVSVRYRVYGTGNLRTFLVGYQDLNSSTLPVVVMDATTDRIASVLANYRKQKTQIVFQTTGYDETFVISKIIAFVKPSAAGYPQL